jgi:hypothetical protein
MDRSDNVSQGPHVQEVKLVDVVISDENVALNVIVSFLSLANKRGAFGIDESAKIWECVKMFQKPN